MPFRTYRPLRTQGQQSQCYGSFSKPIEHFEKMVLREEILQLC